jgi:integrase
MGELYNTGLQYRSMGVARSALSVFLKICSAIDINSFEEISRFMKGAFLERPTFSRYETTWDVNIVLNYLQTENNLTLLQLTCKFCMLFLLLTAQRGQNLHLLEVDDVKILQDRVIIFCNHLLKQSRPGYHAPPITLKAYTKNKSLCIVNILQEYLKRTAHLRLDKKLLVSTVKPHKAVSRSTISRWVKLTMTKAGVGNEFAPHSVRAASTSMAKLQGVPLECILKTAGWANTKTFGKYYDKPIKTDRGFQDGILL